MDAANHDAQLRQVAFSHVNGLAALRGGVLDSADLASTIAHSAADQVANIDRITSQLRSFRARDLDFASHQRLGLADGIDAGELQHYSALVEPMLFKLQLLLAAVRR